MRKMAGLRGNKNGKPSRVTTLSYAYHLIISHSRNLRCSDKLKINSYLFIYFLMQVNKVNRPS